MIDSNRTPIVRYHVILIFVVVCALAIAIQFAILMLFGTDKSVDVETTFVERGPILDRNGRILAIQTELESVTAWTPDIDDPAETARLLAPILDNPADAILEQLLSTDGFTLLSRAIPQHNSRQIEELQRQGHLAGIGLQPDVGRNYPERHLASALIGYVGIDHTGLSGIEYTQNSYLSPQRNDADSGILFGNQIFLTIDINVQYIADTLAQRALEENDADSVTIIVMNARDGALLAAASVPGFDPNVFVRYNEERRRNRIISSIYEPGSVFKIFSISSFIELGGIQTSNTFQTSGGYVNPDGNFEILDLNDYGSLNSEGIIKYSSNVGAAYASDTVSKDAFYRMIRLFGFGEKTGIELNGEERALVGRPLQWSLRTAPTIAIGQEIGVTAIQMVGAATVLANDGILLKPQIIDRIVSPSGQLIQQFRRTPVREVLSPETAHTMLRLMNSATEDGATARRVHIDGLEISAKTGTAEVFDVDRGVYSDNKFIASCLAIVPTEDPQLIVYVIIEYPKGESTYGGRIAAPVTREMIELLIPYTNLTRNDDQVVTHSRNHSDRQSGTAEIRRSDPRSAWSTQTSVGSTVRAADDSGDDRRERVGHQTDSGSRHTHCPRHDTVLRTAMSLLADNLAALDSTHSGIALQLADYTVDPTQLIIHTSTIGVPTGQRNGLWLHSRRDPRQEARRMIVNALQSHPDCLILFGFGMGYYAEAFLENSRDEHLIIIVADAARLLHSLSVRDMHRTLQSPRIHWLIEVEPQSLIEVLKQTGYATIQPLYIKALFQQDEHYLRKVDQALQRFLDRRQININTLERFGRTWVRNLGRNLTLLAQTPGVSLINERFSGLPALILGAGPSLDYIIPHLAQLRQRCLIVAVDTTLKSVIHHGVQPDMVVVVDPQYWNTRHLDHAILNDTVLVSEPATHPRVFQLLHGDVLMCDSPFPLGTLITQAIGSKGVLGAGGSVVTTAWDLVRRSGANPIWFAGIDLGFPGNRTHARGSWFEERMHLLSSRIAPAELGLFRYLHDAQPFPIKANNGGYVLTDRRMTIYRQWFEAQTQLYPESQNYNLSANGVALSGIASGRLEVLLDSPPVRGEIDSRMKQLIRDMRSYVTQVSAQSSVVFNTMIADLCSEMYTIEQQALDGLLITRELQSLSRQADVVQPPPASLKHRAALLWRHLDEIDSALGASRYRDIIGFLISGIYHTIIRHQAQQPADSTAALTNTSQLYSGIAASARFHLKMFTCS